MLERTVLAQEISIPRARKMSPKWCAIPNINANSYVIEIIM